MSPASSMAADSTAHAPPGPRYDRRQVDRNPHPTVGERRFTAREILARYPLLTDDHLRYLRKWGLAAPAPGRPGQPTSYGFADLARFRQVSAGLADGLSFQAVVRRLLADSQGQLALDFQSEPAPAKVIKLTPRAAVEPPPPTPDGETVPAARGTRVDREAESLFLEASAIDTGEPASLDDAVRMYREALRRDPDLVPALINLGNAHYTRGSLIEAQALYEKAIATAPEFFEAHFNLGNVMHDLGRFDEACLSYRDAIAVNPRCAEAHFYLAVTLEKAGRSGEARAHWRSYQDLAPDGEWADLAREFSE
jgi:tetratricopeptide (TPR) repeat protein